MKHVLKRAYNLEGQMTGMDMDGQSGNEYTWTYETDTGQLLSETTPLLSETTPQGTLTYTYQSGSGLLATLTYPNGHQVQYSYNAAGNLSTVQKRPDAQSSWQWALGITYDAYGRVAYQDPFVQHIRSSGSVRLHRCR
jgi:YD repeat-containing protein